MSESETSCPPTASKRKALDDGAAVEENEIDEKEELEVESTAAKRARLVNEEMQVYLENLPSCDFYEKSYMHRDHLIDICVSPGSDFIITASVDGHVKFWKKMIDSIEFVKHFRAHLGRVSDASCSSDGSMYCTVSDDKTIKVFDVINYDMCNMLTLDFVPSLCQWIFKSGDATCAVAVTEKESHRLYIFDGKGGKDALKILDTIHRKPITGMAFNAQFEVVISSDRGGMLEYWAGPKHQYDTPIGAVNFQYKTDTDLYELAKAKTHATSISVSPSGKLICCCCLDRTLRVFKFTSGKLYRSFDESNRSNTEVQQQNEYLSSMEFGKRLAVEKDLLKSEFLYRSNAVFDESENFLLYPTLLGVKVVHMKSKGCVKFIGQAESIRLLSLTLYQGCPNKSSACVTMDMRASSNPALDMLRNDPCLFSFAFKQKRFYIFSNRDPQRKEADRDVLNEKPTKDEQIAAAAAVNKGGAAAGGGVATSATIHTVLGDMHLTLFPDKVPKTVENFVTHANNGYYNNHIFHRVIKAFMIQTGDPTGTGMGGESIWGHEFKDEFHPALRHDRPYTVSMANSGPNTNASQFFITVVPTPWLDDKHTVFGRLTKGLDVVKAISQSKTNPRTEKPYEDIKIINISTHS